MELPLIAYQNSLKEDYKIQMLNNKMPQYLTPNTKITVYFKKQENMTHSQEKNQSLEIDP